MEDELWRASGIEIGTGYSILVEGTSKEDVLTKIHGRMFPVYLYEVWEVDYDTAGRF